MTLDEAIRHCLEQAEENEKRADKCLFLYGEVNEIVETCRECAADHKQLSEWLRDLKEAKRLLQAAEKTIDDYCRGYCECCKNRDFELAKCGLVNGCRDKDNWEWILSYRVKELFKED